MVNSKTIKTIRALPVILLLFSSIYIYQDTFFGAVLSGLGFLCLAIHTFYIVFTGEKELEHRFGNRWRGALFLFGLLIISILFLMALSTDNLYLLILVPPIGILYIGYLKLVDKIFPDQRGTKSNLKIFIWQSIKLLAVSIFIVFLIGSIAFILGTVIN